jgi:hypothetical protein
MAGFVCQCFAARTDSTGKITTMAQQHNHNKIAERREVRDGSHAVACKKQ